MGKKGIIHVGRPLTKRDIGYLVPQREIIADNMDCQGGSRLDYLADHLTNGPKYGRGE